MKPATLLLLICISFLGCTTSDDRQVTESADVNSQTANAFLDAFYSFDKDSLQPLLTKADDTGKSILFYQGWAEGGNYKVLERHPFVPVNDSVMICPVTVKDDLIQALELEMHVTDSFHIEFSEGAILSIETSSNDPPLFHEARKWVRENRPELTEAPCGGESENPADCCKAVVQGFKEFMSARDSL